MKILFIVIFVLSSQLIHSVAVDKKMATILINLVLRHSVYYNTHFY